MQSITKLFGNDEVTITYIKVSDDEYYFKAKEVAEYLGYIDTSDAIKTHIPSKYKITYSQLKNNQGVLPGLKMHPETIFLKEAGLYKLATSSKMPKAEAFQDWIFEEVIPSIRKTGKYELKQPQNTELERCKIIDSYVSMCSLLLKTSCENDDRDKLLVNDCMRNLIANQKQITNGDTEEWSISRRLNEKFNIHSKKQMNKIISFGKLNIFMINLTVFSVHSNKLTKNFFFKIAVICYSYIF